MIFRFRLSLIFLLFTFLVAAQEKYSVKAIPLELRQNANSVLISETIEVDISQPKKQHVLQTSVVTVFNKKGDNDIATYVSYADDSKIKEANIWIYDKDGKEIKRYKKRDFTDVTLSDGFSLFNSARVMYVNYTPVNYPYTMVFTYEFESETTAFLYGWNPLNDYASSTQKSEFRVKFDAENKPRYDAKNLEKFNITISENPGELIFKAENIKAIEYEEGAPSLSEIGPSLSIALDKFYLKGVYGEVKNWNQFGSWMDQNLLTGVRELPEGTVANIKNLIKDETTNEGKARKIYKYLQDKVRYVSIQIGIGGWKPMLASDVDKLSYGDCKALTNYTKALLEVAGVPSYYTIVYAGEEQRDIKKDFTALQGNHAILGVPDGDTITWLECTSQITPYGYNGTFTDDRDVLIITPEGGKIVRTKKYPTQENVRSLNASLQLKDDLKISGALEESSEGLQYERYYHLENEKQEDILQYYKERWGHLNNFNPSEIEFENDDVEVTFTEKMNFTATNYVSKAGSRLLLNPNIFNRVKSMPATNKNRSLPYKISRGQVYKDEIEITLPDEYKVESVMEAVEINESFGSYKASVSTSENNKIVYTREFIIEPGSYLGDEYQAYTDFMKTVIKKDRSKIVLSKKN
ncbi:DUF3857 domain-containing protein [Constantimarinum furrinae]|uniref:DUF3857 domain-containing protein n=1 Tax=Constantimarinum furrinae TaxID=2562285 RepID=A0A7G8PRJ9_9FLAO|nr:DUF3857 domain-containing protein [Constantimarinum furrinae]QNJ96965.1 hypothetical protein ALE3EI_0378 [Constantimarinum furrinae]